MLKLLKRLLQGTMIAAAAVVIATSAKAQIVQSDFNLRNVGRLAPVARERTERLPTLERWRSEPQLRALEEGPFALGRPVHVPDLGALPHDDQADQLDAAIRIAHAAQQQVAAGLARLLDDAVEIGPVDVDTVTVQFRNDDVQVAGYIIQIPDHARLGAGNVSSAGVVIHASDAETCLHRRRSIATPKPINPSTHRPIDE